MQSSVHGVPCSTPIAQNISHHQWERLFQLCRGSGSIRPDMSPMSHLQGQPYLPHRGPISVGFLFTQPSSPTPVVDSVISLSLPGPMDTALFHPLHQDSCLQDWVASRYHRACKPRVNGHGTFGPSLLALEVFIHSEHSNLFLYGQ